jgi:hypothetical protein
MPRKDVLCNVGGWALGAVIVAGALLIVAGTLAGILFVLAGEVPRPTPGGAPVSDAIMGVGSGLAAFLVLVPSWPFVGARLAYKCKRFWAGRGKPSL